MENTLTISDILPELMFDKKIKMIELSHQTGVPQSTLSRILSRETTHPHRSSLEPLAAFFQISVDQLLGREPISSLRCFGGFGRKVATVPLLTFAQVVPWLTPDTTFATTDVLHVDMDDLGEHSFAVTVDDAAMEPQFPRDSVLIVDASKTPRDRSFVIAKLGNAQRVVFRQFLSDGLNHYLRSISPDFSQFGMITMTDNDSILGVVLQARKNYLE